MGHPNSWTSTVPWKVKLERALESNDSTLWFPDEETEARNGHMICLKFIPLALLFFQNSFKIEKKVAKSRGFAETKVYGIIYLVLPWHSVATPKVEPTES